ncbi:DNA binding domain protein, excisionase family [Desulfarculus baarsii DSM 2075]|uniref:DNA binding domain protein, excisionase family n=1 Tax=Desulfarculus baarsii (strain ATCC 33931 / DSM 2075 / LMG 7858 / VKM B-1802 / 2st14) TaxID=644282 RepID=E1QJ64_DESB2|nr:helix-turn-helix domain-containing protein [Desulfarculus baarsii]ADK85607.1 DNA binding domain protein, excisionase family [Desulfarculus baarsii DSM 2075]
MLASERAWLRARSAAELADVSLRTMRSWLAAGLPHSRVAGGAVLIKREALDAWLAGHAVDHQRTDKIVNEVLAGLGRK